MQDKTIRWLTILLLLSGGGHLGLWWLSGQAWEGAVSLRKPALFGISGGLTVWSLAWVMARLPTRPRDWFWSRLMAWALLVEVGLITLQYWRGVPSHFNHATALDAAIERTMLTLILMVTGIISWLCWRVLGALHASPTMAMAIRAGMILLWLSCLLGIGTTVLGQWNLNQGHSYQVWGKAGVLKFPHGVALHAIQLLPIAAWLFEWLQLVRPRLAMQGLIASQVCFMLFAIRQTWQGRARFDADALGGSLLLLTAICVVVPLAWNMRRAERSTGV